MPPKKGHVALNIALPEDLALQLGALAVGYDGSKSKLIESALRAHLDGSIHQTTTDSFHQHLATVEAALTERLHALDDKLALLATMLEGFDTRLRALEADDRKQYAALVEAFDRLKQRATAPGPGQRLWGFLGS